MKNKFVVCHIIAICILLVTGCKHKDEKFISEGRIEYDVVVVDDQGSGMASMIPRKMTIKFKNNKSCATMSAGMGLFATSFISDPETETHTICMKLLNKKMVTVQNTFDIERENSSLAYELIPTKETKVIAGYNCIKVHVRSKKELQKEFDIFYTKELDFRNPNFANPFHELNGVLMEYQIKKMGFELRFIATAIIKEEVEDDNFTYTADHKKISNKEMNDIFKDLR
jgi:GLPGLI family protein